MASKSQMTPLPKWKNQWVERATTGKNQYHLSPENTNYTNHANPVTALAKRAKEHDE